MPAGEGHPLLRAQYRQPLELLTAAVLLLLWIAARTSRRCSCRGERRGREKSLSVPPSAPRDVVSFVSS